jgi:hypothetical protein
MQEWTIKVEFYPGETMERDRWWWMMREGREIVESNYGPDPEFIAEDIAVALNKFAEPE